MSQQIPWRSYEEVAQHLLDQIAEQFGLGRVEGKQIVSGASGACWEIDAKGVVKNDEGFVIIECRRYTKQGVPQEEIGGLAFRIQDTGAVGGIIVSPLPLQSGAKIVAESEGIHEVQLSAESTNTDFVLRFLERTLHGVSAKMTMDSQLNVQTMVIRAPAPGIRSDSTGA
jgi:hypothetical protein